MSSPTLESDSRTTPPAAGSGDETRLLRRTTLVDSTPNSADFFVDALPAISLPGTPGWLTGESLLEQGVEVTMPNLPDLELPGTDPQYWRLAVVAVAPRTLRIRLAPVGHRVFREAPGWIGIVTADTVDALTVTNDGKKTVLTGDGYEVHVGSPLSLRVTDSQGKTVLRTAERLRQVAGFPLAPAALHSSDGLSINLELAAEEDITGFGEQFGRLVKNGQHLLLRTEDALGTGSGLAYKPVPVWHSSAGYAGFVNTGAVLDADIGHVRPSVLGLTVDDNALDLYLFIDDEPEQRLADYTALTGRSIVPPVWAFGYWMGRCRYHSADEMLDVSRTMTAVDVPNDVLHVDPDWLVVDRLNTDFIWNTGRFGDRREFVDALKKDGRRLSVWELPYVDPASPVYDDLAEKGYFVTNADGDVASLAGTPTPDGRPRALLDFTNPDARAWWGAQHEPFLDDGVAVFKTDFGEGFPPDGVLAADIPQNHHHNLYTLFYNGAVSDAIGRATGRAPLVWGRSGWAGSHRYPGQWGGDAESTVAGMQATLRGGLSYSLSAPGFWSHDIGGFFGPELTPGLYVRWTQFGAFSPLMRAHGLRPREPWAFGDEALEHSRTWIRRRYELLPYLWNTAHSSVAAGLPMMRPLSLQYPADRGARGIDDQFLLGEDLLVVPVFDDSTETVSRTFYVPEGDWTDLYTGAVFTGPGYRTVECEWGDMPVLARPGSVIPHLVLPEGVRSTDDVLDSDWEYRHFGAAGERDFVGFDGELRRSTSREGQQS